MDEDCETARKYDNTFGISWRKETKEMPSNFSNLIKASNCGWLSSEKDCSQYYDWTIGNVYRHLHFRWSVFTFIMCTYLLVTE